MRAESLYAFQARPWTLYPWLASLLADHMICESVSDKLPLSTTCSAASRGVWCVQGSPIYPLSFLQMKLRTDCLFQRLSGDCFSQSCLLRSWADGVVLGRPQFVSKARCQRGLQCTLGFMFRTEDLPLTAVYLGGHCQACKWFSFNSSFLLHLEEHRPILSPTQSPVYKHPSVGDVFVCVCVCACTQSLVSILLLLT